MKHPKVQTKEQKSYFFVFSSCFTVSVAPSINTLTFSSDLMILIISFIFSFEINKVSPLPVLTSPSPSPFSLLRLSVYYI